MMLARHKVVAAFLLAGLVAGRGVLAGIRDFHARNGTTVRGELLEYNRSLDRLTLRNEASKTVQIKGRELVAEDMDWVRDWDKVRLFSQNTHFRVYIIGPTSLNKWTKYLWRRPPGKVEPYITTKIFFERVGYDIKFDNQTGYDLENVQLKYNIFYRQERMDYRVEKKVPEIVVRPAVHTFTTIAQGRNMKFPSGSIVLRRKEIADASTKLRYLAGEGRFLKSELVGMVFRASITTPSGQATVREIRVPKNLSEEYVWVEPTADNSAWQDDQLDEREDTQKPPTLWEESGRKDDESDG